jgi:hypothetical protein
MKDAIDGSFNDPEGRRKIFVRRRPDEDADDFAERALEMMILSGSAFIHEKGPEEETSH